ncbi:glutamyl-tRNA reductase [Cellulosilyticum ruminicola]|uniref:glutamyl-tRNA reductase n=1 Tax=Cellulosilyticum ruminicola TaxID=425254 RepID=UPI0006CF676D|nr:glutamyl-tRNA reductase [Cellulosilyticum ruminicola]
MEIAVIGVNHKVCPIEIRECVAFTESKKIEGLNFFNAAGVAECIILSTCNRSEIYICDDEIEDKVELVKEFYRTYFDAPRIKEYLFEKIGSEAISHLYHVAAGLDSIVIGEDQILGQVKDAHTLAMAEGTSKKVLNKVFREAVTTAKEIKSTTKMSEHPLSVSHISVKFLKELQGSLEDKKALIIGVGKMNELTIKYLKAEKVKTIYVTNRTHARAETLADKYEGLTPILYEKRYDILGDVDFVVSATASPHVILKKEHITKRQKPLYMVDIAMPRDIDPSVRKLKDVYLYDIDDLKAVSEANNALRQQLVGQAEMMIMESMKELNIWLESLRMDPIIWGLNARCEQIGENTMHQINKKLNLSEEDQEMINKYLLSALRKVIREPIVKLRGTKDHEEKMQYAQIVETLFDLNKER